MQRKHGDRNVCRFFISATGANLPVFQWLKNAHFGTCRTLVLDGFLDISHTNLIEAWQHQFWGAPKDRLAFHLFLIENEQQKTWKKALFECLQNRAIWHMSHTGAWWISHVLMWMRRSGADEGGSSECMWCGGFCQLLSQGKQNQQTRPKCTQESDVFIEIWVRMRSSKACKEL
jgi:hypothetical protein